MKKFFKIIGALFLILLIALVATSYYLIKTFDLNKYKSYASEMVEKELGRKFSINGNASIGLSLVPTLILEDVELANASWAKNPQMVKVQKLELKFALMPLIDKQVVVDKAILITPEIYLEKSKEGRENWIFENVSDTKIAKVEKNSGWLIKSVNASETEMADVTSSEQILQKISGFAAKNVIIENGFIQYDDDKTNSITKLNIKNIHLSVPSM